MCVFTQIHPVGYSQPTKIGGLRSERSPWSKSSRMLYWPFICLSNDHLKSNVCLSNDHFKSNVWLSNDHLKSNVWLEMKYYLPSLLHHMCWRLLNNSLNLPSYQTDILSFRDVYHDHKRRLFISTICLTAGGF